MAQDILEIGILIGNFGIGVVQGNERILAVGQILKLLLGFLQVEFVAVNAGDYRVGFQVHAGVFRSQPGLLPEAVQVHGDRRQGGDGTLIVQGKAAGIIPCQNLVI